MASNKKIGQQSSHRLVVYPRDKKEAIDKSMCQSLWGDSEVS